MIGSTAEGKANHFDFKPLAGIYYYYFITQS